MRPITLVRTVATLLIPSIVSVSGPATSQVLSRPPPGSIASGGLAQAPSSGPRLTIIRDAETETLLRNFSNPLFRAAGVDPNLVRIILIRDNAINSFVSTGNLLFVNTGLIVKSETALEMVSELAHETGHIAGGHLAKLPEAMRTAMIESLVAVLIGDLFACQPIAAAVEQAGGNFIFTCKPTSHRTIVEYLQGAELEEHRQTVVTRGKRTTTIYRWLSAVPLRATEDALSVNWFSIEIQNNKGKRTYYNSFVTDLPVTSATVAELAACGRARWKVENEIFNVPKTNGYNLEHNFGHGKETLAFAFHTASRWAVLAWRKAVIARGATYRFFEHLRTVTAYVVFQNWDHLLRSIEAAAVRPP